MMQSNQAATVPDGLPRMGTPTHENQWLCAA
jgi:hypothetical protein